jgi:hypothetical protein
LKAADVAGEHRVADHRHRLAREQQAELAKGEDGGRAQD